jgi:nucleotide-binding universal stress UspA family protein/CheY-like chemotaxis protein
MNTIHKVLVPVDGSGDSKKALEFAGWLVNQTNAGIYLLHVVEEVKVPEDVYEYIRSEEIEGRPERIHMELIGNRILDAAEHKAQIVGSRVLGKIVAQGNPAETIVEYSKTLDVDLIVIGGSGLGGYRRHTVGGVCSKVSRWSDRTCVIVRRRLLDGRKVLIVDDELDVLETLEELLPMCEISKASSFEDAQKELETKDFDIAVLDIMGVRGFDLLRIAQRRRVLSVMLTGRALSPESTIGAFKRGAASYVPKDELSNIRTYLNDVLEVQTKGSNFWFRWLDRFRAYYEKNFGPDWLTEEP